MKSPDRIKKLRFFLLIFIVVIFISFCSKVNADNSIWSPATELPNPLASGVTNNNLGAWIIEGWSYNLLWHSTTRNNDRIYVLGGYNFPFNYINNVRLALIKRAEKNMKIKENLC